MKEDRYFIAQWCEPWLVLEPLVEVPILEIADSSVMEGGRYVCGDNSFLVDMAIVGLST